MDDVESPQQFADRLRELVNASGYSLRDLARKTRLSKSGVHDALDGEHFPSLEKVVKIVRVCAGDEKWWREKWAEVNAARRNKRAPAESTEPGWRRPPPRQLPATVADFVGRADEFEILTEQLKRSPHHRSPVVITSIEGTAGVGKTALAVWWGSRMTDRFPHGQLYVDLRGYGPGQPRRSGDAVAAFLGALGVPAAQVPGDEDERTALYRSLLAGKKTLVVLDNAASAEQVRPLLPGPSSCLVIVTSRDELPGLVASNGAQQIVLDRLAAPDAVELLRRIIGRDRVDAEPEAADEIARRCAYLPLALRVAAQRALSSQHLTLTEITSQLATAHDRLDLLATPDNDRTMNVRVVFSWSYQALPTGAARLFRLLGLHAGPEIGIPAAAALADITTTEAAELLEIISGAHLLDRVGEDRYRFHDLLHDYAAEQAVEDETAQDRAEAVLRVLETYLHAADAADKAFTPTRLRVPLDPSPRVREVPVFDTYAQAMEWFDLERTNLAAATRQAADAGNDDVAWKIPAAMSVYCYVRKPWEEWLTSHEIGLAAARRGHAPLGEAALLSGLGAASYELREHRAAVEHLEQAVALWRDLDHLWGEAIALNILGSAHRDLRQFEQAITCFQRALAIWPMIDQIWGKGVTLHNLGTTYRELGEFEQAVDWLSQSIEVRRAMPDRYGEGWALHDLGVVQTDLARFTDAITYFDQALTIRREIGDRHGEAQTHYELGKAAHATGDSTVAEEHLHDALTIFDDLHDPRAHEVKDWLSRL
ncbi:tetratricopeptide repeat protein [Actinophytocola sp.]|uniref:tetratricopeptide repeat protein n=1 Tax=Actinophytocola sp. TaxID=1872138 RepID=UPI002ED5B8FA